MVLCSTTTVLVLTIKEVSWQQQTSLDWVKTSWFILNPVVLGRDEGLFGSESCPCLDTALIRTLWGYANAEERVWVEQLMRRKGFLHLQAKSVLFYIAIRSAVCYAPFPPTSISFFTRGSLHSVLLVTHFAPSPWFSLLRTDDCNFILRILCKTFLDFVLSITTLIAQYVYNIPIVLMFLNIGLHLMESLNKKMDMWQCKSCVHVSLF